jgi:dihydrofolate reductase
MISIICAMDSKRGIGKDGGIPWHIPADFKRFKEITIGHPMIMGRRTFESIGRVLPGRTHIVISRRYKDFDISIYRTNGLYFVGSLREGIKMAKKSQGSTEIFIIGGGEIFKEALDKNLVDKMYLTIIEGNFSADTYFPEYPGFKIDSEEHHDNGKYKYKFVDLVR